MERVLEGKVAIVTGAAGPMGLAAAQALAADGARIALVDLPGARLDAAAQALDGDGAPFACDLAQPEAAAALAQRVTDALGRVDILVNNAGVLSNNKAEATDDDEWRHVMAVNVDGPQHGLDLLVRLAHGRGIAHVARNADRRAAEEPHDAVQPQGVHVHECQLRAVLEHGAHHRHAHGARRAGDDDRLVLEAHGRILPT